MREILKFITEPRVSVLGGLGFVAFYELIQDDNWIAALIVASIAVAITWYGRR